MRATGLFFHLTVYCIDVLIYNYQKYIYNLLTYTIWLKVCGYMSITVTHVPSLNYSHKVGSTQLYWVLLYAVA